MRLASAALLLLLLPFTLQAKDADKRFATYGLGSAKCSSYNASRNTEKFGDYRHFIHGYLSAFNLIVPNNYDILEQHSMAEAIDWLDRFCNGYPGENLSNALAYLTEYYYELRVETQAR